MSNKTLGLLKRHKSSFLPKTISKSGKPVQIDKLVSKKLDTKNSIENRIPASEKNQFDSSGRKNILPKPN